MSTKTLIISSVLSGFLFFMTTGVCFAGTSELLEQAQVYTQEGNYEKAEAIYLQIVTDSPDTEDAFLSQKNLTILYIVWNKQPQADTAFRDLLDNFSQHKDMPYAVNGVAYQYITAKNNTKAAELYQYVLSNWPGDERTIWSLTGLTISNIALGNYPAAYMAADKLLSDFAGHEKAAQAVRIVASDWRKSQKYLQKANQLDKYIVDNHPETEHALWAQTDLTKYHIADGNDTASLAAINKLLTDFSEHKHIEQSVHTIAAHCRQFAKPDLANQLDQLVVDTWPDTEQAIWALMDLVQSFVALDNDPNARTAINKLLEDYSKHERVAQAVHGIATQYRNSGKSELANPLYRRIVDTWPKTEHALWAQKDLTLSYIEDGNDIVAEAAVDKLLTDFAGHERIAQAVHDIASQYLKTGKNGMPVQLCQHIVENWPESEHALWAQRDLAKFHIDDGNDTEAQAAIDKLVTQFSRNDRIAQAVYDVAKYYQDLQKYEEASLLYQHVIDNWPKTEHAAWAQRDIAGLSVALDLTTLQDEIEWLIADFNDHKNLPVALFTLGEKYYNEAFRCKKQGLDAEAKENFTKAIEVWKKITTDLPPSPTIPEACNFMAVCYVRLDEYEVAIKYYQMVLDNWPDYKQACYTQFQIGRCYERLKNAGTLTKSEANPLIRTAYEAVVKNYPDCTLVKAAQNWLDYNKKPVEGGLR